MLTQRDLDVALDWVLQATVELTNARYAAVAVFDDAKMELTRFITRGVDEACHPELGEMPPAGGVVDTLLSGSTPGVTVPNDLGEHLWCYRTPPGRPSMRAILGAPIVVGEARAGNLCVTEKADGIEFSEDDEHAVAVLANLAAVAIDRSRREAQPCHGIARIIPSRLSRPRRHAAR
jgi:two-component system sensor histidine kinase DevS